MGSTFRLDARLLTTTVLLLMGSTLSAQEAAPASSPAAAAKDSDVITLERFVTEEVDEDPNNAKVTAPSAAALGFSRKIEETPRSVTSVSSQLIDRIGIRDADQLYQVVPGTFTVNRWGIAGATKIRSVNSDTYLRGMKRIEPQGNIRNVITMWDNTEIVRGPPSPVFGNGRIGGYANYTPKSARGTTGKYLEKPQGSITAIYGSYDKVETQVNYAQPLKVFGKEAGFQVFAQANDSDSYYDLNFQKDRVLQGSYTMNLSDKWRLETGVIYQKAENAGQAGANRVSQKDFDQNRYLRGTALYNMDRNGDGTISEDEIQRSRDAVGTTGTTRYTGARPLVVPFSQYAVNAGTFSKLPTGFSAYLAAQNPTEAANPASRTARLIQHIATNNLEAPAGTTVITGRNSAGVFTTTPYRMGTYLPGGFLLDPETIGYSERDWSLVAIEEKASGHTYTGYFDLIDDTDPDYTLKNQILYDYQKQTKRSQLPFNQSQEISAIEDKATFTVKKDKMPFVNELPEWFVPEWLVSANIRYTNGFGKATSGDYDHRRDLMTGYTANDTFSSYHIDPDGVAYIGGEPVNTANESKFVEAGTGTQLDLNFFKRLSILGGFRYDAMNASVREFTRYNRTSFVDQLPSTANATNPTADGETASTAYTKTLTTNGADLPLTEGQSARGMDDGISHSISVTYKVPYVEVSPYYTRAKASAALTGSRQDLNVRDVINSSTIGQSKLEEFGFKGSLMKDKLFYGYANYRQQRSGNTTDVFGAGQLDTTVNRGHEIEVRFVPDKHWTFMTSASFSKSTRIFTDSQYNSTATQGGIVAEQLGFQDIKYGPDANDIYPANALLYGGNPQLSIENNQILEVGQYPQTILTGFVGYNWSNGFSVSANVSYVSTNASSATLINQLELPEYYLVNTNFAWEDKTWRFALTVRNIFDEEYFSPNSGAAGGSLLQAGIPTNFELSATRKF